MRLRLAPLVAAAVLASCATPNTGPYVTFVCIEADIRPPEARAWFDKKAAGYLKEYGFSLAKEGCEVTAKYTRLGDFDGKPVQPGVTEVRGYWREEGVVNVIYEGRIVVEHVEVEMRRYETRMDLLEDLAWEVIEPVTRNFRSRSRSAGR
jgi:hypothetical protein